jgi:hypothetical protein
VHIHTAGVHTLAVHSPVAVHKLVVRKLGVEHRPGAGHRLGVGHRPVGHRLLVAVAVHRLVQEQAALQLAGQLPALPHGVSEL